MAQVCVFGVSGFVGSHLAEALLQKGYTVVGTLRNPDKNPAARWLNELSRAHDDRLTLVHADMHKESTLGPALQGCTAVFFAAWAEVVEDDQVEAAAQGCRAVFAAAQTAGARVGLVTSSTGSTNPPSGKPEVKVEGESWTDVGVQLEKAQQCTNAVCKRLVFGQAAKTIMDKAALDYGAENPDFRVVVFNPSLITGPCLSPEIKGGAGFVHSILQGRMAGAELPDDSMSMIDVRDLAALQVAGLESPSAQGRYFAVRESWHWKDIISELQRLYPDFPAPLPFKGDAASPTMFNMTRRDSLGVQVRDIPTILQETVEFLKQRRLVK
mmetsp:Transcript_46167/g.104665  ORF Transcript_46167/g.104665 Transcript_46167/m.104665 type:complete len:326 (+) Transcript_46167:39-1016(+)